jgi:hypothetical protein
MMETSHASPVKTDLRTPCTSSQSMLHQPPLMTPHLDHSPGGSGQCLLGQILNSLCSWSTRNTSRTGALLPNLNIFESMTKKLLQQMQKSTSLSKTFQPLSMIMPYVNSISKHCGVLKVSLTSKGWVPSLPMLSGALILPTTKMTMTPIAPYSELDEDIDSGERVMKQP